MPFFVLGLGLGVLTIHMEKTSVGARGPEWDLSAVQRVLIAGRAAWFYAGKLIWPAPLMTVYPRWHVDAGMWRQYLFPAAALALVGACWLLRRRLRAPLAAVLFFGGTLVPALGFFDVFPFRYSFVADHYQYLASIGLLTLLAAGLAHLGSWCAATRRGVLVAAEVALVALLGALAWQCAGVYQDSWTLWNDNLAEDKNPNAWVAWINRGQAYYIRNDRAAALADLNKAIQLNPKACDAYEKRSEIYQDWGDWQQALAEVNRALTVDADYVPALFKRGEFYQQRLRLDDAIADYTRVIELRPDLPFSYNNRGMALLEQGKIVEATQDIAQALELYPEYPVAQYNRGCIYQRLGQLKEALAAYTRAIKLKKDLGEAYLNRGKVYLYLGELTEALNDYNQAVALRPHHPSVWHNRALLYYQQQDYERAWADLQRSEQLGGKPDPQLREQLRQAAGRPR